MWDRKVIKAPYVLEGYAAKFYVRIVQNLVNYLMEFSENDQEKPEIDVHTGCVIFDNASLRQKIYLLNFCLSALLKPEVPIPHFTHILEATVYYPFQYLLEEIHREVEDQEYNQKQKNYCEQYLKEHYFMFYNRRLTYKAYHRIVLPLDFAFDAMDDNSDLRETVEDWKKYYYNILDFDYESTDLKQWDDIVSTLAHSTVLDPEDEDFRVTSLRPQLVDGADRIALNMGIDDDYLTNRLPKVSGEEFKQAIKEIFSWNIASDL